MAKSFRIIRENLGLYLFLVLLLIGLEVLDNLEYFNHPNKAILVVSVLLSAALQLAILRDASLITALRLGKATLLAAILKVGLIGLILAIVTLFEVLQPAISAAPEEEISTSSMLYAMGFLTLVLPAITTLLGSWVPAGIAKHGKGFLPALGRGVKSFRTVYWRLLLALSLFILVSMSLALGHWTIFGTFPSFATEEGLINLMGVGCGYLILLCWLAVLTYVNVVVCMDYVRFEKINLGAPSSTPLTA